MQGITDSCRYVKPEPKHSWYYYLFHGGVAERDFMDVPREFGFNDWSDKSRKYCLARPMIREFDEARWWNPPLKKEAVVDTNATRLSENAWYGPRPYEKMRQLPGRTLKEHQKELYDNSPHVQLIKSKWNISPEHPGLPYNDRYQYEWTPFRLLYPWQQGVGIQTLGLLRGLGPNYYDAPEGKDCIGKTIALAKWGAYFGVWRTLFDYFMYNKPRGWKNIGLRYFALAKYPVGLGALYGAVTCLAADRRHVDDWVNPAIGGTAAGIAYGLGTKSMSKCSLAVAVFALTGILWKIQQLAGLSSEVLNISTSEGFDITPQLWKDFNWDFATSEKDWKTFWRPDESKPFAVIR